jgi:hypothetical protein
MCCSLVSLPPFSAPRDPTNPFAMGALFSESLHHRESQCLCVAGIDEKTFRKWTWIVVYAIAAIPDLVRNTFLLHFSWLAPSLSSLIAAITSVAPSRFVQFSLTVEMYFSHCAFVTTDCLG